MTNELELNGNSPDARNVFTGASLTSFSRLAEERMSISAQITELEKRRKEVDDKLTNFLTGADVKKVEYNRHPIQIIETSRPNFEKTKMRLIEVGVSPLVISESTVMTPYSYLLIGKEKK